MVAALVSLTPVAPVVSATSPAPSLHMPPVVSASLPTAVAGAGAPVPPLSSCLTNSGEFHSGNVPGGSYLHIFLSPLYSSRIYGPPGPWLSHWRVGIVEKERRVRRRGDSLEKPGQGFASNSHRLNFWLAGSFSLEN